MELFLLTKEGVCSLEGLELHKQQPWPPPRVSSPTWSHSLTLWAGRRRASGWLCWVALSNPGRDRAKVEISAQAKARDWCELGTTPKPLRVFTECEEFHPQSFTPNFSPKKHSPTECHVTAYEMQCEVEDRLYGNRISDLLATC